jgi:hypothetical protein
MKSFVSSLSALVLALLVIGCGAADVPVAAPSAGPATDSPEYAAMMEQSAADASAKAAEGEAVVEGETPATTEGETPATTEGEAPASSETETPAATEGEAETSKEKPAEEAAPAEGENAAE